MKKIATIQPSIKNSIAIMITTFMMVPVGSFIFYNVAGSTSIYSVGPDGMLVVFIMTMIVHELLHGVGFLISGVSPRFGIGIMGIIPVLYTTAKKPSMLTFGQMFTTGYLPLFTLSICLILHGIVFPEYRQITSFAFIVNFVGSMGDIFIMSKLIRYRHQKDIRILDTKTGVEIYSK